MRFNYFTIAFAVLAIETPVCDSSSAIAPSSRCPGMSLVPADTASFKSNRSGYIQGLNLLSIVFPKDWHSRMIKYLEKYKDDMDIDSLFLLSSKKTAGNLHTWGLLYNLGFPPDTQDSEELPKEKILSGLLSFLATSFRNSWNSACRSIGLEPNEYSDFITHRLEYMETHSFPENIRREMMALFLNKLDNKQVDLLFLLCSKKAAEDSTLWNKLYISVLVTPADPIDATKVIRSRLIKLLADAYTIAEHP